MTAEEKRYHLIDQYLNGELQGRALDQFKAQLKDPEFRKAYDLQVSIVKAIEDHRKMELKSILSSKSDVKYIQNMWGQRWTYVSAAVFVLFISAFFIIKQFNLDRKQETLFTHETDQITEQEEWLSDLDSTMVDSGELAMAESTAIPNTQVTDPGLAPVEDILVVEDEQIEDTEAVEELVVSNSRMLAAAPESAANRDLAITEGINDSSTTFGFGDVSSKASTMKIKTEEMVDVKVFKVNLYALDFNKDGIARLDSLKQEDKETSNYSLRVEFWVSPVSFQGYKYASSTGALRLYGIGAGEPIHFKEFDNKLYLYWNGSYYSINKNGEDHKFVPVKHETIIRILNE